MIRALAQHGIIGWDGVEDHNGQPLPWKPDFAEMLANHPVMGPAFLRAYEEPVAQVTAEGNVSAPSPNGNSVGAETTAAAAPIPAESVPAP